MAKQTVNNVGIYLRLSQEDMRDGDSLSIENQKMMLTKFVNEKGWNLVSEYVDDGYTGTDFERPDFQRLLDDAKYGKINTIIVKDLSRFGRNYIEVGQYVDYIFPAYNIRFIALSDNVDTLNRNSSAMDMMPIVNLVNANYGQIHSALIPKNINTHCFYDRQIAVIIVFLCYKKLLCNIKDVHLNEPFPRFQIYETEYKSNSQILRNYEASDCFIFRIKCDCFKIYDIYS